MAAAQGGAVDIRSPASSMSSFVLDEGSAIANSLLNTVCPGSSYPNLYNELLCVQ